MLTQTAILHLPYKSGKRFSNQSLTIGNSIAALATPELQDVLSFSGNSLYYSALLGRCEDGPPLLFDFSNPRSGSMLIAGSKRCGKTQLLRTIALSACQLNPPELVSFYIFTCLANQWNDLAYRPHCLRIHNPNSLSTRRSIRELTEYALHRQSARLHSPVLILFIDNLDRLLENLPGKEFLADLNWLVKHGPKVFIWTIATQDSARLASLPQDLTSCFTTLIIGKSLPNELEAFSSRLVYKQLSPPLIPGGFVACFSHVQIRFRTLLG